MNFAPIIFTRFDRWKPQIEALLKKNHGYATAEDMFYWCSTGQKFFFDNDEAWAIMEVIENPNYMHMNIQIAGGTTEGLLKLYEVVAAFGKEIGAKKMTFIGRKGFTRKLKEHGWKSPKVYMEKEL